MKNFELEQMGVQEMDADEVKKTDGGVIDPITWVAFGIGVALGLISWPWGSRNK